MNDTSVITRLRTILRESSVEERDWNNVDEATTIESLGFDSLYFLDLLYEVEMELGIKLEAKDVLGTRTIGDFVDLLK
jgi:acyl carrier protein